jgi:hypothetical protein
MKKGIIEMINTQSFKSISDISKYGQIGQTVSHLVDKFKHVESEKDYRDPTTLKSQTPKFQTQRNKRRNISESFNHLA